MNRWRRADRRSPRSASNGEHGKIGGIASGDFTPVQRSRHAGVGKGARSMRASRSILRVLVVVEEYAVPFLFPPLRACKRWRATLDGPRQCEAARRTSLNVQRVGFARSHAFPRSAGLGQPVSPISSSRAFTSNATVRTSSSPRRDRIEVDAQFVRMVQISGAHGMRMQLDTSQIDDPSETSGVVNDNLLCRAPRWKRQRHCSQPRGRSEGARF